VPPSLSPHQGLAKPSGRRAFLGPLSADGAPRFAIEERLGAGGMGVVYLAHDRERAMRVALKTLHSDDPANLARFKAEFRALADVAHRGLVELYELFADEGTWFFTMEVVDGLRFDTYSAKAPRAGEADLLLSTRVQQRSRGELLTRKTNPGEEAPITGPIERLARPVADIARLVPALAGLVDAVHGLHRAGMTHCDLKPSNVLVTSEGRVVVLDFGLVRAHPRRDAGTARTVEGTPHYVAPEVERGAAPTPAADWYAVGVMLYWSLTGHLPLSSTRFADGNPRGIGARPSTIVEGVPDILDRLVGDLLDHDPTKRAGVAAIRQAIAHIMGERAERDASAGGHGGLAEPAFVGREEELARLEGAFRVAAEGRPSFAIVRGPSGIGKSALARELGARLAESGRALVLAGRCYEREQVRFKALDGMIDALAAHLSRLPGTALAKLLPEGIRALSVIFPVLGAVDAIASAPPLEPGLEPSEVRARAVVAARTLLDRLGAERPVVIVVDDVQWGDSDSAALLAEAIDPRSTTRLLFVATARGEAAENEMVRAIRSQAARLTEIELGPMDEAACVALAHGVVNPTGTGAPPPSVTTIARDAGGSPFLVLELARWASRAGGESAPLTLEEVVARQVSRLPDEARRLLELSALAGVPLASTLLGRAAKLQSDPLPVVRLLCARSLLRASAVHLGEVEPYHDRVREVVANGLNVEQKRELNFALGDALHGHDGAEPEMVARHLGLGGDHTRAMPLFVRAAARAAASFAYEHSVALYREALACAEHATKPTIERGLAEALVLAGRAAAAAPIFARLAMTAVGVDERAACRRRAAEEWLKCGNVDDGVEMLRAVLEDVGLRYPGSQAEAMARAVARIVRIRFMDGSFTSRDEHTHTPETLARIDATRAAGTGLMLIDPLRGYGFLARFLLDAHAAGEPRRFAAGLAFNAVTLCRGGERGFPRAVRWLEASRAIAERLDDDYLRGLADACEGGVLVCTGRWRSASRLALGAPAKLRSSGAPATWESTAAVSLGRTGLLFAGEIAQLRPEVARHLRAAEDVGDRFAATYARVHGWFVAAMDDDVARGRAELRETVARWSSLGFHAIHLWALFGQLQYHLYEGTPHEGLKLLDQQRAALEGSRILAMQFYRIFMAATEASLAISRGLESDRRSALKIAAALSKEDVAYARAFAAQIRARCAPVVSDAVRESALSARLFELSDMKLHTAAARALHGRLSGGEAGRRAREEALLVLTNEGVVRPERWLAMLGGG